MCGCPRDRLCDQCRAQSWAQLRGVAASRGEQWAIEAKMPRTQPWPAWSETIAARAMERLGDLAADARLLSMLAAEAHRWAAKRWSTR